MWIYGWGGEREVSKGLRGLYPPSTLSTSLHNIPGLWDAICGCVALYLLPPGFRAGSWLPLGFRTAGDSVEGIVLPGASDTNLGRGMGVKNPPLLCKNWHLTFSGSAEFRQTQGVWYIPWVTLPGDVLFLIQCCRVLLKSCFPLTQRLLQFSDGLKQLSIFLIPLQGEL